MLELRIKDSALADLSETVSYYEGEAPGLGEGFRADVFIALQSVIVFPMMYPEVRPAVRRIALRRLPYVCYYRLSESAITLQAVLSAQSDPDSHRNRLDEE
jgi:plasmid stabilization system protein ParE